MDYFFHRREGEARRPATRGSRTAGRFITAALALCVSGLILPAVGCGHTVFVIQVGSASNKLEEARELGAEKLATYEFYYASEHLRKARAEAAEADYSDAIDFAEISEQFAEKAIRLSREAHRGAGR